MRLAIQLILEVQMPWRMVNLTQEIVEGWNRWLEGSGLILPSLNACSVRCITRVHFLLGGIGPLSSPNGTEEVADRTTAAFRNELPSCGCWGGGQHLKKIKMFAFTESLGWLWSSLASLQWWVGCTSGCRWIGWGLAVLVRAGQVQKL